MKCKEAKSRAQGNCGGLNENVPSIVHREVVLLGGVVLLE